MASISAASSGPADAMGAKLHNPPHVVRWNAHKSYLLELASHGIPIVPTVLVKQGSQAEGTLAELLEERGWGAAVVMLTMLASASFDPRLTWDPLQAEAPRER